jgi:hypothetical protein
MLAGLAAAGAVLASVVIPAGLAGAGQPASGFTMAVYGDSPYGTAVKDPTTGVVDNWTPAHPTTWELQHTPQFIDNINADPDVSLVAHVGDIHSGKDFCALSYDQTIASDWTAFQDPLVYTPGDNEWADCHKSGEGSQDPLTNLGYVRDTFFSNPGATLGGGGMTVTSQANAYDPAHPEDAQYVENVMFEKTAGKAGIMFVTLNLPGGSNNDADPWFGAAETADQAAAQALERQQRTDADLRWLDQAFSTAKADKDKSVVIIEQADMWDLDGKTPSHLTNYDSIIQSIADHTLAFDKPVLLFAGDSHTYRSDNPLRQGAPCVTESGPTATTACANDAWANHQPTLPNINVPDTLFHRVIVHGSSTPLEWLKLTVHPTDVPATDHSFGLFSWTRQATGLQP